MKILSSKEKKILDSIVIKNEPIESIELMERVALNIASTIVNKYNLRKKRFLIICGKANNGGDGLALARILVKNNVNAEVAILNFSDNITNECKSNLEIFNKLYPHRLSIIDNPDDLSCDNYDIIVDAIFGTGLNKPVQGYYADIINKINAFSSNPEKKVFSIDIPSGIFGEDNSENSGAIIKANTTFFVHTPPLSSMYCENRMYFGNLERIILAENSFIENIVTENFFDNNCISYNIIDEKKIQKIFPIRNDFYHKNNFGHPLLIAGSYGKAGAAILSAKACLKSGVGLLSAYVPKALVEILQCSVPEMMIEEDSQNSFSRFDNLNIENIHHCYGIGPGLGKNPETIEGLKKFLLIVKNDKRFNECRFVFDADALNSLSMIENFQDLIPNNTILTPHPKEFERLFGHFDNSSDKINFLLDFCKKINSVVIYKDSTTIIVGPGNEVFFNIGNNSGMAKAGSGDVLTGILTAFQAQCDNPVHNAVLAVYLHSLSGKIASKKIGKISMTASDIVDNLPPVFKYFESLNCKF